MEWALAFISIVLGGCIEKLKYCFIIGLIAGLWKVFVGYDGGFMSTSTLLWALLYWALGTIIAYVSKRVFIILRVLFPGNI